MSADLRRPRPCDVCGQIMLVQNYCWHRKRYCSRHCMGLARVARLNSSQPSRLRARTEPICGVYAITHIPSGRTYIGSSVDVHRRWRQHRQQLDAGSHPNGPLAADWRADGRAAFSFTVLYGASNPAELGEAERQQMRGLHPFYNGAAAHVRQFGTQLDDFVPYPSWERRFWAKVDLSADCWLWRGALYWDGYGQFSFKRKGQPRHAARAHRLAYVLEHGAIPQGAEVCHSCDRPACVRPAHLFLGSRLDNHRDMMAKGRLVPYLAGPDCPRGEQCHSARVSANEVRDMRRRREAGEALSVLATAYGLARNTVWDIVQRKTWKHIV